MKRGFSLLIKDREYNISELSKELVHDKLTEHLLDMDIFTPTEDKLRRIREKLNNMSDLLIISERVKIALVKQGWERPTE